MEPNILDDDLAKALFKMPQHADFGIRLAAFLLDTLILLPLAGLNFWNLLNSKSVLLMILVSVLTILYKPLYEYYYAATIGKKLCKLKVVNTNYKRMTLEQSFLRSAPWLITGLLGIISNLALFQSEKFAATEDFESLVLLMNDYAGMGDQLASWFVIISCMFVLFHPKKQALHDIIARTFCVYDRDEAPDDKPV